MTACQLYAKQNSHRKSIKRNTEKGREYLMAVLKADPLGSKIIDTVKLSDAKWKRSLKASFYTAIEDNCIRKNPFDFSLDTVLENDTEEKIALTQEQEDSLLAFAAGDPVYKKYCDEIIILLGTELRISELCGLTVHLDFANRQINVDHQLLKDSETGYYADAPKTKNGIRQIPMSDKVYEALKQAVKNRGKAATVNIDGHKSFLFLNQSGYPKVSSSYERMFKGLVKKYNKQHKEDEVLPNIMAPYLGAYLLHALSQRGNEPESVTVHYGPFQHYHDTEVLRTRNIGFCKG